jgi:hypothetical protein
MFEVLNVWIFVPIDSRPENVHQDYSKLNSFKYQISFLEISAEFREFWGFFGW